PGRDYGAFRVISGGGGDDPSRIRNAAARAAEAAGPSCDRLRLQATLIAESARALAAVAPDEAMEPWQRRNLTRYAGRLARQSGMLVADLFDLVVAGRASVSDNFAYELHRLAVAYPWQSDAASGLATVRIRAEQLFDGVRRVRLTRRLRRPKVRRPE